MSNNKGLFGILLKRFLLLSAIILLGGFLIFFSMISYMNKDYDFSKYSKILNSQQYEKLPVKKVLGNKGYINILDNNNKLVYSSNGRMNEEYTDDDILCISESKNEGFSYVYESISENGEKYLIATVYNENEKNTSELVVLNSRHKIVYSTIKFNNDYLSEKSIGYLSENYPENFIAKKMSFKAQDQKEYLLISYRFYNDVDAISFLYLIVQNSFIVFMIFLILVLLLYIPWLYNKVKRPLMLLNENINSFSTNCDSTQIKYNGPKEFEEIFDSFNVMSNNLVKSKRKEQLLKDEKQRLISDISHDLKTPVTVILGYSKAICDGVVKDEDKEAYIKTIYQKSVLLSELINTFHEYSKLENPDFKVELTKTDICEFIREYLADKYSEIENCGFCLDADIPEKIIFCSIDKMQMKRVFENIVNNSLKHNKSKCSIKFSISQRVNEAVIKISDNGSGVSPEVLKNIFEPFVTGDESRTELKGSGLGLSITKKIIEAHGGSIKAENINNNGTGLMFTIIIRKTDC